MTERSEAIRLLTELSGLPESSPQRQELRDKLVEMHMPLVEYLARRFSSACLRFRLRYAPACPPGQIRVKLSTSSGKVLKIGSP